MGDEKISPGDAEELAVCFTAHARELFGYARFLARGDRALADDLVQAAFEAAGRAWWPGPTGGSPRISPFWNSRVRSSRRAITSPDRSPKRRNSVPLPTPASAAIASIETCSTP